jgi:hypothetical protein
MDPADEPIRFDSASPERRVRDRRVSSGWVRRVELPPAMARIAWSGVWGGFLIALAIWITLTALGAAVGLSGARETANLPAATFGKASAAWLYVSALIALFFGGVFGTRLALIVDGAIAWLEATLIWTFALLLTTAFMTTLVGVAAARATGITEPSPVMANPAGGAWLTFAGIVIAWIVTVLGSLWGRAQSRSRAHTIGLAA